MSIFRVESKSLAMYNRKQIWAERYEVKMRRLKEFALALVFLFCVVVVFAQSTRKVPKGMEVIRLGGSAELIIPKGAHTRKVGAQIIVEGTKEYMSRRFEEMDERFTAVEQNQVALQNEIETLKGVVSDMQKTVNPSTNAVE